MRGIRKHNQTRGKKWVLTWSHNAKQRCMKKWVMINTDDFPNRQISHIFNRPVNRPLFWFIKTWQHWRTNVQTKKSAIIHQHLPHAYIDMLERPATILADCSSQLPILYITNSIPVWATVNEQTWLIPLFSHSSLIDSFRHSIAVHYFG